MDGTSVATIAELARASVQHVVSAKDGREFVLAPDGFDLREITDLTRPPPRLTQATAVTTLDSFVEYFNDFAVEASRIFADVNANRIVGVLDFHEAAALPEVTGGGEPRPKAQHTAHRVTLELQLSEEWKRWGEVSGKLMDQADFARWLEENLVDIETPAGADVLEIVRDMSAARKVNFKSVVRAENGDREFEWTTETTAASKTGSLSVPSMFVLRIPIFYGSEAVEVRAFLRWRLQEGGISFGIELYRPAYVKQAVFEKIAGEIRARTGRPVHFGKLG